jgi:hypothetical protein
MIFYGYADIISYLGYSAAMMEVYNVTISRCPDSKIKIPIKHLNISRFYLILEGKWQLLEKLGVIKY